MQLSRVERLMLSNQYKILEKLYPAESDEYRKIREGIERGYEWHYAEIVGHIYGKEYEMSTQECDEVLDILELFSLLTDYYNNLEDKSDIDEHQIRFLGFDGNNESKQMGYTRYLIHTLGRFESLYRSSDDFNSHCPSIDTYRAMVKRWKTLDKRYELSREKILTICTGK